MLDIYTDVATDEVAELVGTWVPYKGAKLLIARTNNRNYTNLLGKLVKQYQKELDAGGPEADELSDRLMAEVFAKTILLGWEDVGYKGEPLPYSAENAQALLRHKQFRAEVAMLADDVNNFRIKLESDQEKN